MLRLIHTADWQLGKPYGRFDSDVRAALSEARFDAIDAIGKAAAEHEVRHVLVAGDVFDTEGPEDRVIVQAVSRMQRYACTWPAPALKRIDAATAWIAARGSASATNGVPRDTPRATGEKEIDPVLRVDDDRALRIYGSVRMVFYS